MTLAFDAGGGAAVSTGDLSWTHTPVGTPRAIIVLIVSDGIVNPSTACTYGGVAMSKVSGSPNLLTAGEGGAVDAWFLGSSIPTGAQTVSVTVNGAANKRPTSTSLTGAANTEVVDTDVSINAALATDPSAVLALTGRECFCVLAFHSGHNSVTGTTPFTNWTSNLEHDFGLEVAGWYTYNIVGTADVTAGWTQAEAAACAIALAVAEVAGAPSQFPPNINILQSVNRASTY